MNVNVAYILGSPSIAQPPIIIHASGIPVVPDPDEIAKATAEWQNPLYPRDAALTVPQMEAEARADTLQRAQSPGILLCLLDGADSVSELNHPHTFSECMD